MLYDRRWRDLADAKREKCVRNNEKTDTYTNSNVTQSKNESINSQNSTCCFRHFFLCSYFFFLYFHLSILTTSSTLIVLFRFSAFYSCYLRVCACFFQFLMFFFLLFYSIYFFAQPTKSSCIPLYMRRRKTEITIRINFS